MSIALYARGGAEAGGPRLLLGSRRAWKAAVGGAVEVSWVGYLYGAGGFERLAGALAALAAPPRPDWIARHLRDLDGHFALVARGAGWTLAAVDRVRGIPLFYARVGSCWTIGDNGEELRREVGLGLGDLDEDAALALAMAGYTVARATLYRGLEMLGPGEFALFGAGVDPVRGRHYVYRPWQVRQAGDATLGRELAETTLGIFDKLVRSLDGRPVVVPLSAGRDSRLVASALRHLGYPNVRCFSYGLPGNFEAKAACAVAERLGYPWTFVPVTAAVQRRCFAGAAHREYLAFADTCASVPFEQDFLALETLKTRGFVPGDAVIANGNSGDYITGNHIHPSLLSPRPDLSPKAREERILEALLDKHFHLWEVLDTAGNRTRIVALLRASWSEAGAELGSPETDHGLYEYAEFQDRQCKYVITGQRIYEFFGHDWRLPLWDNDYLDFWQGVPLSAKAGQRLYANMLASCDWGGVWHDIPVNAKTVRPAWLRPIRFAAKLAHAPLGRAAWRRFERRYLAYWMDNLGNYAVVPYARVFRDRRGARNAIAWLAERYLAAHGLEIAPGNAGLRMRDLRSVP